jgi:restriction system protein
MPIPDFQTIMLPLLECLGDRQIWAVRKLVERLAERFALTAEELVQVLPSGQHRVFSNRIGWAKSDLKAAGLLESPSRGLARITELGVKTLSQKPEKINIKFLKQFPSYLTYIGKSKDGEAPSKATEPLIPDDESLTPLEMIDSAFQTLKQTTTDDLLTKLKECSPAFFEHVVVKLLMAMGYGGIAGEGNVTGKSGDGGIDGVIKQDKLGLDVVCIQAKRWDAPVGRPVIQSFVGSMDLYRARKGVILTTSTFTKDGQDFIHRIEGKKVVLIDGAQLAELMSDHNLGVTTTKTYELKEVSNDFFDESEV